MWNSKTRRSAILLALALTATTLGGCNKTPPAKDLSKATVTASAPTSQTPPAAPPPAATDEAPKKALQPPQVRDILEQLAAKKTVWVIAQAKHTTGNAETKKNLTAFLADPANKDAKTMVIRTLDISLPENAAFLKALKIDPASKQCTTLVLAPPKKILSEPILGAASLKAIQAAAKPCDSCGPGG